LHRFLLFFSAVDGWVDFADTRMKKIHGKEYQTDVYGVHMVIVEYLKCDLTTIEH
jgi:hypothetical protein